MTLPQNLFLSTCTVSGLPGQTFESENIHVSCATLCILFTHSTQFTTALPRYHTNTKRLSSERYRVRDM
uniref:Secreted protein n=1 Tax=Steinernema glaseri TaxID=37863 RepID=A0A1I7YN46_9BILA